MEKFSWTDRTKNKEVVRSQGVTEHPTCKNGVQLICSQLT